ncbi:endonuclease/exonuclease/phosphatase family protein [Haloarchaeobius litoreus]|uniref:Endonuclease/exonuclease/phosphatase family protein n=1 Tax=Haloarchaeobius litoreus TaxID=755306 RepID=A0ABD6DIU1_9EURY|nr:endonuclease/exonuclease/phosphatase family protein [Haloarchaeobius litoreus]
MTGPFGRSTTRVALLVAAVVVVAVAAFEQAVSRLYLLNFSTAGPNASAALAVLLVSAPVVGLASSLPDRARTRASTGGALAVPVLLAVALLGSPVTAAVAASTVGAVTLLLLVAVLVRRPATVTPGAALGLLAVVLHRSLLDGTPLYATTAGRVVLFGLALCVAGGWFVRPRHEDTPPSFDADVAPLALFLFVEAAFLGAPGAVATWGLTSPTTATAAAAAGLALAGGLVALRGPPARVTLPVLAGGLVLAVADLLWLGLTAGAAVGVAQACVVGLLARGAADARSSCWRWGPAAMGQLFAVVLLFLFISSLNWAYMPAPLDSLTRGRSGLFLLALSATVPAAVALTAWGARAAAANAPAPDSAGTDLAPVDGDRRTALLAVGGALAGVGSVALPDRRGPASAEARPLTVATYNVHQFLAPDGDYNLEAVARVLRETDAGIVGLQESEGNRLTSGTVDGVRWLADELGYYHDYGAPTSAASYGVALLSAWPVRDTEVVSLPTHDSPRRLSMRSVVETPAGEVPVVCTHFQTQQGDDPDAVAVQGEAAERVVELAGDDPRTVLLGDFNVTPGDDPAYRVLADEFTDAWPAAAARSPSDGGTYPADEPVERIDHVWTGDEWSVRSAATHGGWDASDHRAVSAVLEDPDQSV